MFASLSRLVKHTKRFSWSISMIHAAVLTGACLVAPTWTSIVMLLILHLARMFGITAGYHRYFAHMSYKTSRLFQFLLAFLGCMSLQKGPLWWAYHHRKHHLHSDTAHDPHSPIDPATGRSTLRAIIWAHMGWILLASNRRYDREGIPQFWDYPELRLLGWLHWAPGILLAGLCLWIDGLSGLVWGFGASTILLYHTTFLVNSACHLLGSRRYATDDHSRNLWWAALLTLGEGWHNNHHHYQSSARQGFTWWELDVSYCVLRLLAFLGIVWDLREPTEKALAHNLIRLADAPAPADS
jgi:stearoyl-CoA desaturase (delta-9 desaturase)